MSNVYPYTSTAERYLGILRTNALPCGPDLDFAGIFPTACRINHACDHNAQNFWNENIDKLTIHAIKDISKGEEITISYLNGFKPRQARQDELSQMFKFTCSCRLCSLPLAQSQASDVKLNRIHEIDVIIERGGMQGLISPARRMLAHIDEQVRLWTHPTPNESGIIRAYPDAFQIAVANGDLARASVFAGRLVPLYVTAMGEDSPDAMEYRALARCPMLHAYYSLSMQWETALKDVPEGLGVEEFEDCLWKRNGKAVRRKYLRSRAGG